MNKNVRFNSGGYMGRKKIYYGIGESIAFILIVYVLFFLFNPVKENFLEMNIQPLLIVVVMISLRYGNYIGVLSALIASFFYLYAYYSLGKDLYIFIIDFAHYKYLLMFFLSAVIFGRFKDNYDFKMESSEDKYNDLVDRYNELQSGYEKLKFIKEEFRKRIISSENSIVSLYEIASSLETLDSEEIYTGIIDILEKYLKATAVSIYTVGSNNKYLRLKLQSGQQTIVPASVLVSEHQMYTKSLETGNVVKIQAENTGDESLPLMMGPIIRDGKVIAFVNIDKMEFEMVTDYSYNLFKVILDWINKALLQALQVEEIKREKNFYENTAVMTIESFNARLDEEKERREKFRLEFGLLEYDSGELSPADINEKLAGILREIDVIGYDETSKKIKILLPGVNEENISVVRKRIEGFNTI